MITPIRGRKRYSISFIIELSISGIRNDNPDKGTEINSDHSNVFIKGIRNDNPDKGTEMRGQIRGTL